ncbi:MAG: hypothetical protein AAFP99_08905, partial [Pseudomonadota bacterium]
ETMPNEERVASTQVFNAAVAGDLATIRQMLEDGVISPMTWLFASREHLQDYALKSDDVALMELLVEFGADGRASPFEAEFFGTASLFSMATELNRYGFREKLSPDMMALVQKLPVNTATR